MPGQRAVLKLKPREERRSAGSNKKKAVNKAARWKKGHSCESNPSVRKFRDGASNLQFPLHSVGKNSLLTVGNLGTHREDEMESEYDVLSEDVQSLTVSDARTFLGSQSSCKTFASGWSKCSNRAFEKFLGRFKVDSSLHKEMLSILAATTEVISSMGGKQSETEYFASFVSTLEKCEPAQYHPMMALLCMIIGKVPESVIKFKFNDIYPKVSSIFASAVDANEHTLIRLCCDALGKILRVQDNIVVDRENPDNHSAYYSILKCCLHENPKVRRKGRQVIGGLLNRHNEKNSTNLSKLVLGWILDQVGAYPTCGPKTVCDSLSLLQFTWNFVETISTSGSKKIFEAVLRVMSGGDSGIIKIGLLFFSNVFQRGVGLSSSSSPENESLTLKLITVLWDLRPDWRNNETFLSWLRCILDGVVRLQNEENPNGQKYIPLLIEAVAQSWPSSFGRETSQIFANYLEHIVTNETDMAIVEELFQLLSKHLIAIPPNPNCLTVLEALLDTLSPNNYAQSSREVLLQLVPLYRANTGEVSKTLGMFVKAFGAENLWSSVDPETRKTVILPLLKENLCQANFSFWKDNILPLCFQAGASQLIQLAVWNAFVGFCRDPITMDGFPAELVGKAIVTQAHVRLPVLAGLRQFVQWPIAHPVLKKYSKNYLPLLFNLYIKEAVKAANEKTKLENPGHAEAVLQTIREYLKFCDRDFTKDLLTRAITNLISSETIEEERTPLLDLIAALSLEYVDAELFSKLVQVVQKYIDEPSEQKRAYRILISLVKNENNVTPDVHAVALSLLRSSKGKAKSNAEALRLECLNLLTLKDPSLIDEFLPEAVLNLLSVNTKSRKLAIQFSKKACEHLKSMESMMEVIQIGLKSPNTFIRACTINFMTLALLELKPKEPNGTLIQACIDQIGENKGEDGGDEAVTKAGTDVSPWKESLGFISVNLSLFKSLMGPYTGAIGQVLSLTGNPRAEVNKILARMIKVFGVAGLRAVLPTSNEPKMQTRIKNLQKKIRKMQEAKRLGLKKSGTDGGNVDDAGDKSDDEADSEDDDDGLIGRKKSSKRTLSKRGLIIKEGVVDFLDPKNVTGAVISKPKESKGGDQFKLSDDGRLIIEMEEEMEKGGEGKSGGRKRKMGLSNYSTAADSDEDDEEDAAPSVRNERRKRGGEGDNRSMKSSRSFRSNKSKASTRVSDSSRRRNTTTTKGARPKRARF